MRSYTHVLNEGFSKYFNKLNENNIIPSDYKIKLNLGNTIYFNKDTCYDEETEEEIEVVQATLYNEIIQTDLITPEIEVGDDISMEDIEEDDYTIISSGNDSNDYKILYNNITEGEDIEDALWDSILYIVPFDFEILKGSVREDTLTFIFDTEEQADRALKIYLSNGVSGRKESDDVIVISDFLNVGDINSLSESIKKLDEAVPRDLMSKIKDTRRYNSRQRYGYGDDSIDYNSADMQEITAADVMKMKKEGEDLSDIYVLSDDGDLIELNRDGHPIESGSTGWHRANQSLKKTLENAVKIYKGKIDYFSNTQPDKWAERTSDTGRRWANKKLGNERLNDWEEKQIKEFRRHLDGPTEEISAIRKEYEDGDISRKEMEARIAKLKDEYEYQTVTYNEVKNRRADARYYDSNKAARKDMDAYKEAKSDLKWAKYKLKDNEEKLAKAQTGDGYGNQRVIDLKRKIATLKRDLEYYEKELAENPAQKELANLQTNIDKAAQEINDNQAIIDRLLRRNKNESLKKRFNKR